MAVIRPSSSGWRLAALSVLLIAAVGVASSCGGGKKDREDGNGDVPGSGSQISLGKAEVKDPDSDKLVTTEDWGDVPANQIIVVLRDGLGRAEAEQVAAGLGDTLTGEIEFINLYQIETASASESDLIDQLDAAASTDGVELAFPNAPLGLAAPEVDSCSPLTDAVYQTGGNGLPYAAIGLQAAWDILRASGLNLNAVHVGVMDRALYSRSDETAGCRVSGLADADVTQDGLTHGTEVTHVIGADPDNGGIVGVAGILRGQLQITVRNIFVGAPLAQATPDAQDPTQMTREGRAYTVRALVDMQRQIEAGATIINCSFGSRVPGPKNAAMTAAYRKFFKKVGEKHPQVLFVASAGNKDTELDGSNHYPGGIPLPNVVTVGALDNSGEKASFSNYAGLDGEVTLSAPGVDVPVGMGAGGKAVTASGTSFSAPMVAAAAALVRAVNPALTAAQIKQILAETAEAEMRVPGEDDPAFIPADMGHGVLRVDKALMRAINDLRAQSGKPPLDTESVLAATSVGLATKGGPTAFQVTASVAAAGEQGTDLEIVLYGQGEVGGDARKHLGGPGEVTWDITLAGESARARVTRLDTGACSTVELTSSAPTIVSLSPSSKPAGSLVTVKGHGFGSAQDNGLVTFNGRPAAVTSWSDAEIVVTVPSAGASGDVVVTRGTTRSNAVKFLEAVVPAFVEAQFRGRIFATDKLGTKFDSTITELWVMSYEKERVPLQWTGNSFSLSYDFDIGGADKEKLTISMSGIVSDDWQTLQRLIVSRRVAGVDQLGPFEDITDFTLTDVPLGSPGPDKTVEAQGDHRKYYLQGPEVQEHVSEIARSRKHTPLYVSDFWYVSTDWTDSSQPAEIYVIFYPPDEN